jgi:hypothetical protein
VSEFSLIPALVAPIHRMWLSAGSANVRCENLYVRTGPDLYIRTGQRLYECLMRAGLICDMITLGVNRQLAEIELRGSPARPLHPARSLGPAVAVWPLRIIMEVS